MTRPVEKNKMLQLWCVLLFSGVIFAVLPAVVQAQSPTVQEERAREAERMRETERARELGRAGETERPRAYEAERGRASEERRHYHDRPGELYVAGFGGYTLGHNFNDVEGTGTASGLNLGDIGLKNSGVYGAKIGYFLPNHMSWLGFEAEAFNTTPHFEQRGLIPGSHLRVTTAALNVIARAQMACDKRRDYDRHDGDRSRRASTDPASRDLDYRDRGLCRLQPYIGVGVGVFFAETSNGSSDNAVPGLNALASVRYFFTEHVALFGEYKYNRATFEFDNVAGGGGLKGDYSVSHLVGGLSFHF